MLIFIVLCSFRAFSQKEKPREERPAYDRKEEIIYDGKRYRLYNNYLTIGGGILKSGLRTNEQKAVGIDFHFHIQRQHFQAGIMMSGEEFLSNNNVQGHLGYGLRKETAKVNLAAFGGVSYFNGVIGRADSIGNPYPQYYTGAGLYLCGQAITKLSYDMGLGLEIFFEASKFRDVSSGLKWYQGAKIFKASGAFQQLLGFKIIVFFSGAYRGLKKNYNPHVRSESGKK